MQTWCRSAALLAFAAVALAACSRPSGHVQVAIEYRGGPAPGNSTALHQGTVHVFRDDGTAVTTVHVADGTTSQVDLQPGHYRFEAESGDAICATRIETVRAGVRTALTVVCDVR